MMTQTYFPFDSGQGSNVTEGQWSTMAQHWLGTGVIIGILNDLEVFADSTGRQVKVKPGAAWMKGHYFSSDIEEIIPLSVADISNPRIDRLIIRLDWAENTIQLAVLQGVPAVSPVAPEVTQNTARWEISLAQIRVDAGAITIAGNKVTDERTFARDVLLRNNIQVSKTGVVSYPQQSVVEAQKNTSAIITTGVYTKVNLDQIILDRQSEWDTENMGSFNVKEGGYYVVDLYAEMTSIVATSDVSVIVYVNGVLNKRIASKQLTTSYTFVPLSGTTIMPFSKGDKVEFYIYQNSGSDATLGRYITRIGKLL